MVLREGKEADNKVSEKKHDEKERPMTNETDCKIESDSPAPSNVFNPFGMYKSRVPYPQTLGAPFLYRKYEHREDILETFKQVKVNLPLSKAIRQTLLMLDMCTFK